MSQIVCIKWATLLAGILPTLRTAYPMYVSSSHLLGIQIYDEVVVVFLILLILKIKKYTGNSASIHNSFQQPDGLLRTHRNYIKNYWILMVQEYKSIRRAYLIYDQGVQEIDQDYRNQWEMDSRKTVTYSINQPIG